ncbi:MAG: glycosyltransferase family 4 protein, partial [Bacteroidales bacterium]|nr:glycosyltransferase family 4 protein [Bacteroidales bacterium]
GHRNAYKFPKFMGIWLRLIWKLLTHRYDAVYLTLTCHGPKFLRDSLLALPAKMLSKQLIIHQHNTGMSHDTDKKLYRRLFPLVYKNAKVILLSERIYPDVEKIVDHSQVRICPNGLPQCEITPARRDGQDGAVKILFLSNLYKAKGVLTLLDACKILKDKGVSFICDMVGDSTRQINAQRLEKEICARGLSENINYHGALYDAQKHQMLSQADIFTLPTHNEAFPLVVIEAMMHSLPIVASEVGGIADMVREGLNGWTVKAADAQALADKLEILIKDADLRSRMGEASRKIYQNDYTQEKFEKNLLETILQ